MSKINVALVTGGLSGESVISYKSAVTFQKHLDRNKYNVFLIDINPTGWWFVNGEHRSAVDRNDFSILVNGQKQQFDVVFLGIHGTPGEDGKMQGYLDMLGLPYTTCDAASSALTFNKRFTVACAAFGGIKVAKSMHLFKHTPVSAETVLQQIQLPAFVKPNNGGSSIGMSKVNQPEEMAAAIEKAFKEDSQVLVEEMIVGREFTVGVFKKDGETTVLPITEVKSKKEFFDFEAKYTAGLNEETTPANIDEATAQKIRSAAQRVYDILNCRGVIRIDFIFNEKVGEPFMLEVNTVPGQSEASIIPQQVRANGWTLQEFYGWIVESALANK
jgi:D-alanine-D-alanine ligase